MPSRTFTFDDLLGANEDPLYWSQKKLHTEYQFTNGVASRTFTNAKLPRGAEAGETPPAGALVDDLGRPFLTDLLLPIIEG